MNIVEVIARAGGFSPIAQRKKFSLLELFMIPLEYQKHRNISSYVEALSVGSISNSSSQKFWIYPGDRIEVPERLI